MGVYCALKFIPLFGFQGSFLPLAHRFNAKAASAILIILGQDTTAMGSSISSPVFSISVKHGCDAIEPTAVFISLILAFPAPFFKKVPGILIGGVSLLAINVIRIASLFLIGVYYQKLFHVAHTDIWQVLFIFLAILFWGLWMQWVTQSKELEHEEDK
jgi:exosortase/archaeosortase family protein